MLIAFPIFPFISKIVSTFLISLPLYISMFLCSYLCKLESLGVVLLGRIACTYYILMNSTNCFQDIEQPDTSVKSIQELCFSIPPPPPEVVKV